MDPQVPPSIPKPDSVVLVVDDEPAIQLFLNRAVTRCGHAVLAATSVEAATSLLRAQKVDVALINANLRERSGLELLKLGRELQPSMNVIVITGYANSQSAIDALKLGAVDCLAMPFDFATVEHRLRAAFERRAARREQARLEAMLAHAERLASLGTMAAGVVHELNNPLAFISANLEWVEEQLAAHEPGSPPLPVVREALVDMRMGIARLTSIVRDLRIFSRRDDPSIELVPLERCLDAAVSVASAGRAMPRIERSYGPAPAVRGSRTRLEQVFLNLIVNATQAIATAHRAGGVITLTTRDEAGDAVVEVADNGSGMAAEVRSRLFEPFFTTKSEDEGTGLGLSVCHGIVTQAGGVIDVDSTEGVGTTFRIRFAPRPGTSEAP